MLISPAMNYSFSISLLDVFLFCFVFSPWSLSVLTLYAVPDVTVCGLCYSSKRLVGSQIDFLRKKKFKKKRKKKKVLTIC